MNYKLYKYVVHKNVVGGSSMIKFPLVIAVSERDMNQTRASIGWHTSALINELQEVTKNSKLRQMRKCQVLIKDKNRILNKIFLQ